MSLLDIISVSPTTGFHLDLRFENGETRRFDMRPLLTMKPWDRIASPNLFRLARVAHGTVVWPDEIDIAPETLYDQSEPVEE